MYGVTGSGKSTLARTIGELIGIPATSVDDITWSPGWVPMPTEDQVAHFDALTRGDAWVLDSAYSFWRDLVIERADLVVALDYPRVISLGRLLRRSGARILDRREICNGNRETWRGVLSRDSIIAWHFGSFARKRRQMRVWAAAASGPPVILLRRPRGARAFLDRARRELATTGRVDS